MSVRMVRGPMVAMSVSFAGVVAGGLYVLTVLGKKVGAMDAAPLTQLGPTTTNARPPARRRRRRSHRRR